MGKKLAARDAEVGDGLRGQFTKNFRRLTAGKTPNEIAELLGITPDMARKYIRGPYVPDLDDLPKLAAKLGVVWTELFDSPKRKK